MDNIDDYYNQWIDYDGDDGGCGQSNRLFEEEASDLTTITPPRPIETICCHRKMIARDDI